jgi:hypothetical protein
VSKNFPGAPPAWQLWGLIEEQGELDEARVLSALPAFGKVVHAHLKSQQGIRGSAEKHAAAARDALGDSVIFFMHACTSLEWSSQEVLRSATPEEFQETFSIPPGSSPIIHTIKNLATLMEQLEGLERSSSGLERAMYNSNAKASALAYVSGLSAHCTQMGWSLQAIIEEVWPKVRQRDWVQNKVDGVVDAPVIDPNLEKPVSAAEAVGDAAPIPVRTTKDKRRGQDG